MNSRSLVIALGVLALSSIFEQKTFAQNDELPSCPGFGVVTSLPVPTVNAIEGQIGCHFGTIEFFLDWSDRFNFVIANDIISRGAIPQLGLQPQRIINGEKIAVKFKAIANGEEDEHLTHLAEAIRQINTPMNINLFPESNGDWPIYQLSTDNTPEDFIAAYQYVHDFFKSRDLPITMVWSPNIRFNGDKYSYKEFYPGDEYVDKIALAGYNWGTALFYTKWTSFNETFSPSYDEIAALTSKPIQLGELASTEQGGNKANWIEEMCNSLPNYPQLDIIIWFNLNKETDWRINSSKESLEAFKNCMQERLKN